VARNDCGPLIVAVQQILGVVESKARKENRLLNAIARADGLRIALYDGTRPSQETKPEQTELIDTKLFEFRVAPKSNTNYTGELFYELA